MLLLERRRLAQHCSDPTAPPRSQHGADELFFGSWHPRLNGLGATASFASSAPRPTAAHRLYDGVPSQHIHFATGTSDDTLAMSQTQRSRPPSLVRLPDGSSSGISVDPYARWEFRRARRSTFTTTRRLGGSLHGEHVAASDPRTHPLCCRRHLDVTHGTNTLAQQNSSPAVFSDEGLTIRPGSRCNRGG